MTLGQRIQAHRTKLGLSQEGLGDRLGVSRQAVSKWEADGAVPDTDKLIALSKLFGITLNELLQVEEPPEPDETSQPEEPEAESVSISIRHPKRKELLAAAVVAALVGLAGLSLSLTARVQTLEGEVDNLQAEVQSMEFEEPVAGWDFDVINDNEAGVTVLFQVTAAQYDPAEELEVFFLIDGTDMTTERQPANHITSDSGIYTATVNFEQQPMNSPFILSVGFVKDGVEYVQPLAEFEYLADDRSSYTSLWP